LVGYIMCCVFVLGLQLFGEKATAVSTVLLCFWPGLVGDSGSSQWLTYNPGWHVAQSSQWCTTM